MWRYMGKLVLVYMKWISKIHRWNRIEWINKILHSLRFFKLNVWLLSEYFFEEDLSIVDHCNFIVFYFLNKYDFFVFFLKAYLFVFKGLVNFGDLCIPPCDKFCLNTLQFFSEPTHFIFLLFFKGRLLYSFGLKLFLKVMQQFRFFILW